MKDVEEGPNLKGKDRPSLKGKRQATPMKGVEEGRSFEEAKAVPHLGKSEVGLSPEERSLP